jgi:hypothetical protein
VTHVLTLHGPIVVAVLGLLTLIATREPRVAVDRRPGIAAESRRTPTAPQP